MKTVYSPYSLKKRHKLNSLPQSVEQTGVLVKIIDVNEWGVADLCPKVELGDNDVETEISSKGPLYLRALELAEQDLRARSKKKSLLQDKAVKNNYLVTDYKTENLDLPLYFNQTVKIKGDREIQNLSRAVNTLQHSMKLRIDFNSGLSVDEFNTFLGLLSVSAKEKIEYIEDPTPICNEWKAWNKSVSLAFDFQPGLYNSEFADFQIIKPSRNKIAGDMRRKIFTSAMDHPVGIAHGLRIAQHSALNDCGFLTLSLFEVSAFEKYFIQQGNYMNFSALALSDFGIGMTEELEKLNWITTL